MRFFLFSFIFLLALAGAYYAGLMDGRYDSGVMREMIASKSQPVRVYANGTMMYEVITISEGG